MSEAPENILKSALHTVRGENFYRVGIDPKTDTPPWTSRGLHCLGYVQRLLEIIQENPGDLEPEKFRFIPDVDRQHVDLYYPWGEGLLLSPLQASEHVINLNEIPPGDDEEVETLPWLDEQNKSRLITRRDEKNPAIIHRTMIVATARSKVIKVSFNTARDQFTAQKIARLGRKLLIPGLQRLNHVTLNDILSSRVQSQLFAFIDPAREEPARKALPGITIARSTDPKSFYEGDPEFESRLAELAAHLSTKTNSSIAPEELLSHFRDMYEFALKGFQASSLS